MPDKLVLRSGFAPEDLSAVFNLLAGYGHGHLEVGALAALSEGGALLISQTAFPYARHSIAPQDERKIAAALGLGGLFAALSVWRLREVRPLAASAPARPAGRRG